MSTPPNQPEQPRQPAPQGQQQQHIPEQDSLASEGQIPLQGPEGPHAPTVPQRLPEAETPQRFGPRPEPQPELAGTPDVTATDPAHPTVPTQQFGSQPMAVHQPAAVPAGHQGQVAQQRAWQQPGTAGSAGGGGAFFPPADNAAQASPAQPKSRTGMLLAGLAIGAIIGGVVGGGVAAVVAENGSNGAVVQGGGTSTLSLNHVDSATAISGVAAVATPSVVTLEVSGSQSGGSGSGVIYSEDGYIVTNAHVATLDGAVQGDETIRVKLSDGRIFDGEVVGTDPYADLAVVKIEADNLTPIQIGSLDDVNVGDTTIAIGAPLNLANTVTGGVISALNRGISVGSPLIPQNPGEGDDQAPEDGDGGFPWDFRFDNPGQEQQQQQSTGGSVTLPVIQTDASINPGNSGGALLDQEGKLIGINVAIASTGGDASTAGSVGLGFAIPVNLVTRVADSIIAGEQPSHGLLGVNIADSSQDTDADRNHAGGLVVDVISGGAADEAGLRAGDVITAIEGVAAADGTSVSGLIRLHEGGSDVTIDYRRNGEADSTTVTLGTLEW